MITVTESATRLWIDGEPGEISALYDTFKFRPPDFWRSPAYAVWKRTNGKNGWDGYLSRVRRANGRTCMMRGHRDDLLEELTGQETKLKLLTSPFQSLVVDDVPDDMLKASFKLDHGQRECIAGMLKHAIGTVRVTVSGGKTAIAFGLFAMIKQTFPQARLLYTTPTERLVNQVYKEGKKFMPHLDISQFGGGKRDRTGKDIVVTTVASIRANMEELVNEGWLKSFMVIFYDEVHHAGSPSSRAFLERTPAFFRFGASDTVKDERKEDIVKRWEIQGLIGPSRAEIEVSPLIDIGRVAKPHLYLVDVPEWDGRYDEIPHQPELDTPAWCLIDNAWHRGTYKGPAFERDEHGYKVDKFGQKIQLIGHHLIEVDGEQLDVESRWCLLRRTYDVAVIRNKERNALVVEWAKHYTSQGWPTLIVATRTLHVHILVTLLTDAGLDVEHLTSEHDTKERDRVFKWLMDEPGRVLVSPLVKEGVSLPELRAGIVADVVASVDLARQIIGRFIRKKPTGDNHASITWFVDRQYSSARRNCLKLFDSLERVRGYRYYHPCLGPTCVGPMYDAASLE